MLTLYDVSLAVARIVMPDQMVDGEATAVSATSITDTNNIIQQNELFNKGICWINSGAHAGKVFTISSHLGNKINFATLSPAPSIGDTFTIAPRIYPFSTIRAKITQALDDTYVETENDSLIGDGETLEFSLPSGVWDVKKVRIQHATEADDFYYSSHWREKNGKIRFDYGYAPDDDYEIVLIYKDQHPALTTYASEINHEIDTNWLKYKAAEYLLDYGMGRYGSQKEYRVEERINFVMEKLRGKSPRRSVDIIFKSAGSEGGGNIQVTSNP